MTREELLKARSVVSLGENIIYQIDKANRILSSLKERKDSLYIGGVNINSIEIPYETTAGEVIIMAIEAHIRELEKEFEALKLEEA